MPSNSRSNRVQQLNQRERFPNHDPRRQPPPFRGRGRGRGIAMGVGRRQPHHDPHEEAISESDDSRMEEGIYDARDKDVKERSANLAFSWQNRAKLIESNDQASKRRQD
ncbi:uncharacterized protein LOC141623741 isoform X4 [Silene latifolia]|uniref:uncharacterized protein LOC141623741 isoform X4 n=1 Tax=Silene latifolia TaxID=37657 RepID=UPI003D782DDF